MKLHKILLLILLITIPTQIFSQIRPSSKIRQIEGPIYYNARAFVLHRQDGRKILAYTIKNPGVYDSNPKGIYIRQYDKNGKQMKNTIYLQGHALKDIIILKDDTISFLAEKRIGPGFGSYSLYQIYLVKMDLNGKILFKKALLPAIGYDRFKYHRSEMSTRAKLGYGGNRYSVHMEISRNFAVAGAAADSHMGDYFVQLDKEGNILEESKAIWNASHSSMNKMLVTGKETYTILVGDAHPWGFQYQAYLRKKPQNRPK